MKTIYFVRHGQSTSNAGLSVVGKESPLTEKGKEQAFIIASRCEKLPVELVVASTYVRSKDTAAIIAKHIQKPIEYSGLLDERRRPSIEIGVQRTSEIFQEVGKAMRMHFAEPGWRYSDEENFEDLKARAEQALAFLATRAEQNMVVVTHGFFLRVLIGRSIFGPTFTGAECQKIVRGFEIENTGITVLHHEPREYYDIPGSKLEWRVWTWNDHAHLG